MKIEQIKYFVETVKAGSFSKAAHNLNVSQPALSISISNFEKELNIQLLIRSSHGVSLTPKGKVIYDDCITILEIFINTIASWKNQELPTLPAFQDVHMLCTPALVNSLNEVVTTLSETHPDINLHIDACRSPEQFSIISEKNIPISIGAFTSEEENAEERLFFFAYQNDLVVDYLFVDDAYLVLSPDNPLAKKAKIYKEDLQHLALAYSSNPYDVPTLKNTIDLIQTKNIYRFSTPDGIFQMVANNAAITIESGYAAQQTVFYQNGRICLKPIVDYAMKFHHYILHKQTDTLNNNYRLVLELIKNAFAFKGEIS